MESEWREGQLGRTATVLLESNLRSLLFKAHIEQLLKIRRHLDGYCASVVMLELCFGGGGVWAQDGGVEGRQML
jgi:hypothetical protein